MTIRSTVSFLILISILISGNTDAEARTKQIYTAPDGSARADGTVDDPMSLEAAFRMAMDWRPDVGNEPSPVSPNDTYGVQIILRGGMYELKEPLKQVEPRPNRPVLLQAYPGETPVVSGGRRLPNQWEMETIGGRTVWTQVLPEVARGEWYFRQLWVNGKRAHVPALPKKGHFQIEDVVIPEEYRERPEAWQYSARDKFIHRSGDYNPDWHAVDDIWMMINFSWVQQYFEVSDYDPATRQIDLSRETWSFRPWFLVAHPAHGNHVNEDHPTEHDPETFYKPAYYRIHNVFEALTEPGEFYLDRSSGKLFYLPRPGEDPGTAEVIAPRLHQFVVLRGRENQRLENVVFKGITFSHSIVLPDRHLGTGNHPLSSPHAAVHLQQVSHSAFYDCNFTHIGEYALGFMNGCRDIDVIGNRFYDLGTGAIKAWGDHPGNPREYMPPIYAQRKEILAIDDPAEFAARIPLALPGPGTTMRLRISDNSIKSGTRFFRAYSVISLNRVRNSVIAFNSVEDHYFNAIRAGSTANLDFTAMDVQVLNNRVKDIGQGLPSSNDMGAIYLGGNGLGIRVEGNLVQNVQSSMWGGNGIYVDGRWSCHFTLRNNILANCNYQGIHLKGYGHLVENNIVYNCERAFAQMTKVTEEIPFARVERNIFVPRSAVAFASRTLEPGEWSFLSANNLIWSLTAGPRVEVSVFGGYGILNPLRMRFTYWQDRWDRDHGSLITEVGFADAAAGDFTLNAKTLAAARQVGFNPFEINVGPRAPEARVKIPFRPDNHSALSPAFRQQVEFVLAKMEREQVQDSRPGDASHVE